MKKNNDRDCCVPLFRKTIRIMKITTLFSLGVACCISASTYAQNYKVSINKKNSSIIEILKDIEKNSEFSFFFNDNNVNVNRKASVKAKNASLEEVLEQVFENTGYNYQIIDRQVLVKADNSVKAVNGDCRCGTAEQDGKRCRYRCQWRPYYRGERHYQRNYDR